MNQLVLMLRQGGTYIVCGVYDDKHQLLAALDKETEGDTGYYRSFDFCWGELKSFDAS